ncbi:MAG: formate--tetrahydrofolate ligase [Euryarchaeota archaeon]|nr:formate--tetrahydrofolate ligase [Euryarchaeota archaeon]
MNDYEIAQKTEMQDIGTIAEKIGVSIEPLGRYKAKIPIHKKKKKGRLILVTATSPTPMGEGKTTMAIGLSQALWKLNKKSIVTLREPSLGPVFGMKGGACGGGYSQVVPMADINLHFTGDMHAITSAHNLLSALLSNHLYRKNKLNIKDITWNRVMDMNDRALRRVIVGLNYFMQEESFSITAASEIMAVLCLSRDLEDLKKRISDIIVGYSYDDTIVKAEDLDAEGAMAILLKDAIKPNLVQTLENTPAIIHGGPFANIAHGTNSLIATKTALQHSEYTVTEAGFGSDLGAEKYFNIFCRVAQERVDCVVLTTTVRSLKEHGKTLEEGTENLKRHIRNIRNFGVPIVVAINRFSSDKEEELALVRKVCEKEEVEAAVCDIHAKGGEGGIELAGRVIEHCEKKSNFKFTYGTDENIRDKVRKIATNVYGAAGIKYRKKAREAIKKLEKHGLDDKMVCMAKTQYSLSDDRKKKGAPGGFSITVRDINLANGAGFIIPLCGRVMTMPGLSRRPAAADMDIVDGKIEGLF